MGSCRIATVACNINRVQSTLARAYGRIRRPLLVRGQKAVGANQVCLPLPYPSPLGGPKPTLTRPYPALPGLTHAYPALPGLTHAYPRLPGLTRPYRIASPPPEHLQTSLPLETSRRIALWTGLPPETSRRIAPWTGLPPETSRRIALWAGLPLETSRRIALWAGLPPETSHRIAFWTGLPPEMSCRIGRFAQSPSGPAFASR